MSNTTKRNLDTGQEGEPVQHSVQCGQGCPVQTKTARLQDSQHGRFGQAGRRSRPVLTQNQVKRTQLATRPYCTSTQHPRWLIRYSGWAMGRTTEAPWFDYWQEQDIFSSPKRSDRLWVTPWE